MGPDREDRWQDGCGPVGDTGQSVMCPSLRLWLCRWTRARDHRFGPSRGAPRCRDVRGPWRGGTMAGDGNTQASRLSGISRRTMLKWGALASAGATLGLVVAPRV